MNAPEHLEVIGDLLAIRWTDGSEDYLPVERLRAASPSAENTGERDLLGRRIGGTDQKTFPGVGLRGWRVIGGYALQFDFSDGHNTGLYAFDYLKAVCRAQAEASAG